MVPPGQYEGGGGLEVPPGHYEGDTVLVVPPGQCEGVKRISGTTGSVGHLCLSSKLGRKRYSYLVEMGLGHLNLTSRLRRNRPTWVLRMGWQFLREDITIATIC